MKPRGGLALALLAATALAGCLSAAGPEPQPLVPVSLGPVLGPASGLPLQRLAPPGLDAPPAWALGEWWTYEVENLAYGHTLEVTRVVAGAGPGHYLVGMPAERFLDEVLVMHFPGFGEVDQATLGFDAHDLFLQFLRFPLAEGATWTTQWYNGDPMEARVARTLEGIAEVELDHPVRSAKLTYDAALGEVRSLHVADYLRYEVTGHGFGYAGKVVVPAGQDLIICHGRANGAQAIAGCGLDSTPRLPVERVRLMGPYDRLSFALIAGGTGAFSIEVTSPEGKAYAARAGPGESVLEPFGDDAPLGMWEVRSVAGGQGRVLFEGPAYRVLEVTL